MAFRCLCPLHDSQPPTGEVLGRPDKVVDEIFKPLHTRLVAAQISGALVPESELRGTSSAGQWRDRSGQLFAHYPCLAEFVPDLQPSADLLVTLGERNVGGEIRPELMVTAREEINRIGDEWATRWKKELVRQLFLPNVDDKQQVTVSLDALIPLLDRYEQHLKSLQQRGISIAGRVHELVVARALESVGLTESTDAGGFYRPTKDKQTRGDIVVTSQKVYGAAYRTEVKSLAARERFHTGISSLDGNRRIGLGFFTDPDEFNVSGANTLAGLARAVYLPATTYAKLTSAVRDRQNSQGRPLFRPVEQYPLDMLAWSRDGTDV